MQLSGLYSETWSISRKDPIVAVSGRYCISLAFIIRLPEVLPFFKTFLLDLSFDVLQGCEGIVASAGEFCRTFAHWSVMPPTTRRAATIRCRMRGYVGVLNPILLVFRRPTTLIACTSSIDAQSLDFFIPIYLQSTAPSRLPLASLARASSPWPKQRGLLPASPA